MHRVLAGVRGELGLRVWMWVHTGIAASVRFDHKQWHSRNECCAEAALSFSGNRLQAKEWVVGGTLTKQP
jgi:hypothetical protein